MDSSYNKLHAVSPNGTNISVMGCEFLDCNYAINANVAPTGLLVQNNWAPQSGTSMEYFAWVEGSDEVFLGNIVENVAQHVVRVGGGDRINIAYNDFSNPVENNVIKGTLTIHQGKYMYINHNKLSKGKVTIGPLGEGDGLSHPESALPVRRLREQHRQLQHDRGARR